MEMEYGMEGMQPEDGMEMPMGHYGDEQGK